MCDKITPQDEATAYHEWAVEGTVGTILTVIVLSGAVLSDVMVWRKRNMA